MEEKVYQELVIKPSQELLTLAVKSGQVRLAISLMEVLETPLDQYREMLSQTYLARARANESSLLPKVEGLPDNPRKRVALEVEIVADKAAAEFLLPTESHDAV